MSEEQPTFGGIVGDSYGMQERVAGRELYEAQVESTKANSAAVVVYHQAKAAAWRSFSMLITIVALLTLLAGVTLLIERWRS